VGGEADWVSVCWEGLKQVVYKVPADVGDGGWHMVFVVGLD